MTTSLRTPFSAIAHQLQDDYLPTVRKPLPRELKDLLAQLVALEAGRRRSTGRLVEALQPDHCAAEAAAVTDAASIGRESAHAIVATHAANWIFQPFRLATDVLFSAIGR